MPRTVGNGLGQPESELKEQHGQRLRSSGEAHHTLRPWHKDQGSAGTTGTPEHSKLGFGAGVGTWSGDVHSCLVGVPHQDTFPLARASALNPTSQSRALAGLHPRLLQAWTQIYAPVRLIELTKLNSAGKCSWTIPPWGLAPLGVPRVLLCSTSSVIYEVSGEPGLHSAPTCPGASLGKVSVLVSPQGNACPGHHKSQQMGEKPFSWQGNEENPAVLEQLCPTAGSAPALPTSPVPSLLSPHRDQPVEPPWSSLSWVLLCCLLCAAQGGLLPALPAPQPRAGRQSHRGDRTRATGSLKPEKPP